MGLLVSLLTLRLPWSERGLNGASNFIIKINWEKIRIIYVYINLCLYNLYLNMNGTTC